MKTTWVRVSVLNTFKLSTKINHYQVVSKSFVKRHWQNMEWVLHSEGSKSDTRVLGLVPVTSFFKQRPAIKTKHI